MGRGRFDGKQGTVDDDGNQVVVIKVVDDTPVVSEDTAFVTGDSPATFDVNAELGRNGTQFEVINDGPGNFTVSISNDGSVFGDEVTVKQQEVYSITDINVHSIRITWVSNSAYRIRSL